MSDLKIKICGVKNKEVALSSTEAYNRSAKLNFVDLNIDIDTSFGFFMDLDTASFFSS